MIWPAMEQELGVIDGEVFWKQKIIHTQTLELEGFHDQTISISYFFRWEQLEHYVGAHRKFDLIPNGANSFRNLQDQ